MQGSPASTASKSSSIDEEAFNKGMSAIFWGINASFVIVLPITIKCPDRPSSLLNGFVVQSHERFPTSLDQEDDHDHGYTSVDCGLWHGNEVCVGLGLAYGDHRIFAKEANLERDRLILSVGSVISAKGARELFDLASRLGGVCYHVCENQTDFTLLDQADHGMPSLRRLIRTFLLDQCAKATGIDSRSLERLLSDPSNG